MMSMILILDDTFVINKTKTESQITREDCDNILSRINNMTNDGDDTDYSDDFDSGRDSGQNSRLSTRSKQKSQPERCYLPQSKPKKLIKGRKVVKQTTKFVESLTEKAQSQRRLKLHELQNEIQALMTKQKDLESENKLLKRTQRRQAAALSRYEGHEGELPSLIRSHEEEVRSLRELLRKTTEKQRIFEKRESEKANELEKTKMRLFRLQDIVKEQNLDERITLSKRIEVLQNEVENKNKNISELKHRLELTEKNYKHQISIELHRQKESKKRQRELEIKVDKLTMALKEKERELEIRNIYTGRENKNPKYLFNDALSSGKKKNNNRLPELKEMKDGREKISIDDMYLQNTSSYNFDQPHESINETLFFEDKQTANIENIQILQRSFLPSIESHLPPRLNPLPPTPKPQDDDTFSLPKIEPIHNLLPRLNSLPPTPKPQDDDTFSLPKLVEPIHNQAETDENSIHESNSNETINSQDLFTQNQTRKVNLWRQLFGGQISAMDDAFRYSLTTDFDDAKTRNNGNLLPRRRREKSNMISNQFSSPENDETNPV